MKNKFFRRLVSRGAILLLFLFSDNSLCLSCAQGQSVPPPVVASTAVPDNAQAAYTLPPNIAPDSPLAQIVRLVQAGVEQSVILTYINDSTNLFNLDADKIIYLNDLGVPTELINAMMQHDQQLEQLGVAPLQSAQPAETTETTAQPAEVTVNYFYDTLAPYGAWVDIAGYGWCWRPTVVIYDIGWQPYCNNGHWVYTDCGWYWLSGYSWGWATFHYGRWFHNPRYGWCWWPDTIWAPSWVCWRYDRGYCGWAPLPPRAIYRSGVGFIYDGHRVSAGFNFGLSVGDFTFVATRDFYGPHPWRHRLQHQEAERIYRRTRVIHNFDFDRHNRTIVNAGTPLHDITAVTRQQIHPVSLRDENRRVAWGRRHEQFEHNGRTLIVNRPHFVGSPTLSLHHGTVPVTGPRRGEFHPGVHLSNPAQNNFQRHDLNQNTHPNFNRATPQALRNQSPETHVFTPSPKGHNNATGAPHENYSPHSIQNQTPYHNYNYNNRVLSPRARGFEQQSPHDVFHGSQYRNTTANEWHEQHFTAPSENHYSHPASQRQNQYHQSHFSASRNESHNVRHFNHSEPPRRTVESHGSHHSSSSSSHQSGNQSRDNGQKGH